MVGFVLVHGGYGGAWNWDDVVPLLDAPAVAVDLPGRGGADPGGRRVTYDTCARAVLDAIDARGFDRVVAVGHSMGGYTISALANATPDRVAHLVYLAALAPPAGTSVFDIYFTAHGAPRPQHPDGVVPLGPADVVRNRLFDDLDDATFARVYPRMVSEPRSLFDDPASSPPAGIPRTYVRCAHDVPVPPAMATGFVEHLGPETHVVDLDVGHGLIFTHPALVARVLNDALARVDAATG
jgi:pimeloyl-ACP methyl ester carboxylesterase